MKKLEDFIKHNREAFDSFEPPEKVWNAIENEFGEKRSKIHRMVISKWVIWTAVAASFLLIAITVFQRTGNEEVVAKPSITTTPEQIPDEYAAEVNQFTRIIERKYRSMNEIRREEPELYKKFSSDISKLDSSYRMLTKELQGNPNESVVLQAMIQNLQYQMELLDKQLIIIQKIKQTKKLNNEKSFKST